MESHKGTAAMMPCPGISGLVFITRAQVLRDPADPSPAMRRRATASVVAPLVGRLARMRSSAAALKLGLWRSSRSKRGVRPLLGTPQKEDSQKERCDPWVSFETTERGVPSKKDTPIFIATSRLTWDSCPQISLRWFFGLSKVKGRDHIWKVSMFSATHHVKRLVAM